MTRLILLTVLALGACADSSAMMNDPDYKQGYDMGCAMAQTGTAGREALTAGKPEAYRRGFSSGFRGCGGGQEVGK